MTKKCFMLAAGILLFQGVAGAVTLPPSITGQPHNLAVPIGGTASFSVFATGSPAPSYQWLKDDAVLANNALDSLAISNVSAADAGFYSVVVSNSSGAITSAPALLTIAAPDKTSPTVSISSPSANQKVTSAALALSGTAKSGAGLAAVWYQVNGGGWLPAATANNWSNWTGSAALVPYTNNIQACAADADGNLSPVKTIAVTFISTAPVSVTTNGSGTVSSVYNGQMLQIGKVYSAAAKPKTGSVFNTWTLATNGAAFSVTASPALSFVMQPGLQLTASFSATGAQPLAIAVSVSSTNLAEGGAFSAQVVVKNNGSSPITGMRVDGEALGLDAGWTGFAVPTKFISPVITGLAPGKSVTFAQPFKATTSGTFRFACMIDSSLGSSVTNYSPYVTVYPSKAGVQPETDSTGHARLAVGSAALPLNLYDEETGSTLSGFALGLALDPGRKGQAVLAAVDTAGRYPPQFFLLRGTSEPAESSLRRTIVSGGSSSPEQQPISLAVDQSCAGPDGVFQHVMTPIATTALPPLAPLAAPPSPSNPGSDASQPAAQVLLNALSAAGAAAKNFVVTKKEADCDEVLADDAAGIAAGKATEVIFGEAPERFLSVVAPETVGLYTAFMTADAANGYFQAYRDLALCEGSGSTGVVTQTALLPKVQPYFPSSFLTWNSAVEADNTPLPLVTANVAVTDESGNPISGGSIEMFSTNHLGSGFRAVIEDGWADLPVLANDTYSACVRSPGYITQSQQVTVTDTNTVLQVMMPPQPVKSATLTTALGQPTGFLSSGTQFTLTPHFYDTNGNEVECSGQPTFYVRNPVGSTVATVDPATGVVTIQDGCGAASVFVWCNGIESAPRLVSSDCNGSQPPAAKSTFAINPTALSFTATEGGGNPASQNFYTVGLTNGTVDYTATSSRSWIVLSQGDGFIIVTANITGLSAGTYSGVITVVDSAATQNHAAIAVTLTVKSSSSGGGGEHKFDGAWSGSFSGTYTYTSGSTTAEDGDLEVLIEDGLLTGESPVDGSANVSSSGSATWQPPADETDETPFIFTGTFNADGSASGTWTLTIPISNPGQSGHGSGTWSAVRLVP